MCVVQVTYPWIISNCLQVVLLDYSATLCALNAVYVRVLALETR